MTKIARTDARTRKVSKKDQLIRMLQTRNGVDAAAISRKLGWQVHTTRAAITRLKQAGHEVVAEKPDPAKPTRYRIVSEPAADGAAPAAAPASETADAG